MVKVTFTFSSDTVEVLRKTAARLKKPQSMVVREAIQDYASRSAKMTDGEREHLLKTFDRVLRRIPIRSPEGADAEKAAIRAARRSGGRRTRSE
jgi:hypothetical protein